MDMVKTIVLRESWDVDRRLAEMGLTRQGLLTARDVALLEAANATAFHPANAPGTFSYHHGTWALRDRFVGKDWVDDRVDGIEAIRNDSLKIKVAYCNVDLACDDNHSPKPRSKKGAGAERASGTGLFGDLPQYAPRPIGEYALYYLMVDEKGAAELTRPVVRGGTFLATVERLYLSYGSDDDGALLVEDRGGPVDNFDPLVIRK
jgi:hypothetical protein